MSGEKVPAEPMLIPPLGITTRQSSDVLAIDDAVVAAALRFIRDKRLPGVRHERPAPPRSHVACSLLERRFRQIPGPIPQAEIRAYVRLGSSA